MESSQSNYYIRVDNGEQLSACLEVIIPYCKDPEWERDLWEHCLKGHVPQGISWPIYLCNASEVGLLFMHKPRVQGTELHLKATYTYENGKFKI